MQLFFFNAISNVPVERDFFSAARCLSDKGEDGAVGVVVGVEIGVDSSSFSSSWKNSVIEFQHHIK